MEPQIKKQSEIWQVDTSPNPDEHVIMVKIYLPKDIEEAMRRLHVNQTNKRQHIQRKERQSPAEYQMLKQRYESYKRLDERMKQQQKKRGSDLYKAYSEIQNINMQKQRITFPIFQQFSNRGKCPYIRYTYSKQKYVQIKLYKKYIFQQLKLTRSNILKLPESFVSIWQNDLLNMIRIITYLSFENTKQFFYNLFVKAIDIISISFDIIYGDKKIYRFRYSPFQFRSNIFVKELYRLIGYHQQISVIPDLQNIKLPISDQDFYSAPRCSIFQDLTDQNTGERILQRTNLFYIAYSISKGTIPSSMDSDQYTKKCLWYLYFTTTRFKKFIYTWSFRPIKKNKYQGQLPILETQLPYKQMIFSTPFYLQIRQLRQLTKDDPFYRIRIQYQDQSQSRDIPSFIKHEIITRTSEWYKIFREHMSMRTDAINEQLKKARDLKVIEKPQRQERQLETFFGNRDRFDKFIVGFLVIVSTIIDRHYFTLVEERSQIKVLQDTKGVTLETPELMYQAEKNSNKPIFHWIQIQFEHTILPYLFMPYNTYANHGFRQDRLKCGEWNFRRICKCRRQWNKKTKKGTTQPKGQQILSFPDIFRDYIQILLRHFAMRFIYKDIVNFVFGITRTCFTGWQQSTSFDINPKYEAIFRPVISSILSVYYEDHLRKFQQKIFRERNLNPHQKMDQEKKRIKEKCIDQFTKVVILKILTKGDSGFLNQDKLIAEVTFRLVEFKGVWLTRLREGLLMLRIFQDHIDFEKEYQVVETLPFEVKGKIVDLKQSQISKILQKISSQPPHLLIL